MRRPHLFAFFLAAILTLPAHAATRTWTGNGANNRFTTVANWAEGIVPDTGDDLIFPAIAAQYSFSIDIFPDRVLNSITFQGGNYTASGYTNTYALTVAAGTQNLGSNSWKLYRQVFVGEGASLTMWIFNRDSNFTIDGPGTSTFYCGSNFGGTIVKQGSGTASVTLSGSPFDSLTVNAGTLNLSGSAFVSNTTVNGGLLQGQSLNLGGFRVTGSGAEFRGKLDNAGSFEISNGAKFSPTSCNNALAQTFIAPILTGGILNLGSIVPGGSCTIGYKFIDNRSTAPISGTFTNFPEGTLAIIRGRRFRITYHGGDGNDVQFLPVPGVPFDFDGDYRNDVGVFRQSDSYWYVRTANGFSATQWGLPTDKIVPADYDGDQKTDIAVYRPSDGIWYILVSSSGVLRAAAFGLSDDIPAPADYDGDGRADIAVFRPSDGNWWITKSTTAGVFATHFGQSGDLPVAGDYDGDVVADLAFFRPSNATWQIHKSSGGSDTVVQWGVVTDKLVPADYDGDGKTDIAVYRPSEGIWYIRNSTTQTPTAISWGNSTDIPVAADYDGDGRADVAIFRPSEGNWWINNTTAGTTVEHFGISEDKPIPSAFVY